MARPTSPYGKLNGKPCLLQGIYILNYPREGGGDPPFLHMAQPPRFDVEDIERIFKALNPSAIEDPFGRIEELVLSLGEEHAKESILLDKNQKEVAEELADIKSRTFGILFLQIFKTLAFFFRLLPQGKIIILVLAVIGLLQTLLSDGEVSVGAIRDAVAKTGLADFIDRVQAEIALFTTEIADNVKELSFATSDVFAQLAIELDATLDILGAIERSMVVEGGPNSAEAQEKLEDQMLAASFEIGALRARLFGPANQASNADALIGPTLRGLDVQIRTIPALALQLVRFG